MCFPDRALALGSRRESTNPSWLHEGTMRWGAGVLRQSNQALIRMVLPVLFAFTSVSSRSPARQLSTTIWLMEG